jgi:ribosomal protein L11 methyltransferase
MPLWDKSTFKWGVIMRWQEIAITTTEEMEEAVVNLFYEVGAAGVVIEDPLLINRYVLEDKWDAYEFPQEVFEREHIVVKGYLPVDERLPNLLEELNGFLVSLSEFFDNYYAKINLCQLKEADWANAWKQYFKPQRVSERFVIVPSWEDYSSEKDDLIIELDPGMAFGTGSHPTTMMCIKALEKHLKPDIKVVDVGTGSGILAIAAAKLGAARVEAIDLDALAVRVAKLNVEANGLAEHIGVKQANLLEQTLGSCDLIIANIIADVIIEMAEAAFGHLGDGGLFIASGIIDSKQAKVIEHLQKLGFSLLETLEEREWRTIVFKKG